MLNREKEFRENMPAKDMYTQHWIEARDAALAAGLTINETGWEQHVIIDETAGLVYRYPRRAAAAAKLADEVALLSDIHRYAWPVQLPVMREHTDLYTVYDYIPGEVLTPARVASLTPVEADELGGDIGEFMVQFHRLDPIIVEHKQTKQPTTLLEYYTRRIMEAQASPFYPAAVKALRQLTEQSGQAADVVVHGDLHGPNIVVDPSNNKLRGVIDLSEVEIGDPHLEFRKIFMTFPASLDAAIESYQYHGGQQIDKDQVILWAYVNEWANVCFFTNEPDNATYQRAYEHLTEWQQL